ncbi:YtxH domain-containing protein [bacterium SCSIO 12643]|nr:YtxH domain-containing protein [bacterium SCSIO 12643]
MSKLLVTLTAGFAAGVVAGVLFAPEMGEKTRENIKNKASELGDELDKHYQTEIEKLKAKVSELTDELKTKVEESGIKDKAADVKSRLEDATEALKENMA